MALEKEYLELLKKYRPFDYAAIQRNIALVMALTGKRNKALIAYREGKNHLKFAHKIAIIIALIGGRIASKLVLKVALNIR